MQGGDELWKRHVRVRDRRRDVRQSRVEEGAQIVRGVVLRVPGATVARDRVEHGEIELVRVGCEIRSLARKQAEQRAEAYRKIR